ncbi:hypothetical protein KNU84_gp032 [Bacteriophage DSS3_VP1]|uniref:Uncharacterized protein n=1 Tax=Bacteriophage DSS3_VP1 TaxID=2664196 RepID=A0A7S5KRQ5_9CAUD|nr:hypothetical protein KNU84_gp032 [Bacteriophage DSS3_VP1]QGH74672.1 hypothetical protein DSS3VP1_00104 [Bacteriophage DSS3_VP1]
MSNFKAFARAIETQYEEFVKGELYVVDISDEVIKDVYLNSFPEGTNPVYLTNTEHDCSCCKQFIRNIGKLVALENGRRMTVWGVEGLPYPYDVVSAAMDELVMSAPIKTVFRTSERQFGKGETRQVLDNGQVKTWDHFEGRVGNKHYCSDPAARRSSIESAMQVFRRGMEELSLSAVESVLDLIKDNNLYRGEEHKTALTGFRKLKKAYEKAKDKDVFLWENINDRSARFRNTVIGSLVIDLSKGESLDKAVRMFESKVAPHNYKRPKALITPKMIEAAMDTLRELDLGSSVERRFAKIDDVSVNDVLFVDNSVQGQMKGGLESLLMEEVKPKKPNFKKATKVSIEDFMSSVVPNAKSIHVSLENKHMGNFVSLTAPQHEDSGRLFKWGNDFAWAYDGNITDSIQERVKAAGGKVDGAALRFSLSWFNYDDLDIHVLPPNGREIYFGNKREAGGELDVDMNIGASTREAVENVRWMTRPADGTYRVKIHNYTKRESIDVGFDLQVADSVAVHNFSYRKPVSGNKLAVDVVIKGGLIHSIKPAKDVTGDTQPVDKWGVKTNALVKVQTMMFSPNFWGDNEEGNKHWFFILEGCKNEEPVRGFFNEYLNGNLTKHRKVFEVLADKTKCEVTDNQLSGVGFSSTKKETLNVTVDNKPFEITFG